MTDKKKILAVITGVWAGTITVLTIKNTIDTQFNMKTILQLVRYIEQEQYDGKFVQIINDLQEPPSDK